MKKSLSLLLSLLILVGIIPFATQAETQDTFNDIENHWAKDSILWGYDNNLIEGVSEESFSPNGTMNRAMAITILYRYNQKMDMDLATSGSVDTFEDVPDDSYFYEAVKWGQQNGIINGISKASFAPYRSITRQEYISMLYRYNNTALSIDNSAIYFPFGYMADDRNDIAKFAIPAVQWAYYNEIVLGFNNIIQPKKEISRAEAVTMTERYHQLRITNEPVLNLNADDIEYILITANRQYTKITIHEAIEDVVRNLNNFQYRGKGKIIVGTSVIPIRIHYKDGTEITFSVDYGSTVQYEGYFYYGAVPGYFYEWLVDYLDI